MSGLGKHTVAFAIYSGKHVYKGESTAMCIDDRVRELYQFSNRTVQRPEGDCVNPNTRYIEYSITFKPNMEKLTTLILGEVLASMCYIIIEPGTNPINMQKYSAKLRRELVFQCPSPTQVIHIKRMSRDLWDNEARVMTGSEMKQYLQETDISMGYPKSSVSGILAIDEGPSPVKRARQTTTIVRAQDLQANDVINSAMMSSGLLDLDVFDDEPEILEIKK